MHKFNIEKIKEILSKDMDNKSLVKAIKKIEENYKYALNILNIKSWEDSNIQDKVSILMVLGLGRDRTINALSEFKVNRDNIKEARNSMNEEQNEFRTKNESFITNTKIESTKRNRRLNEFKNANVKWETIAKRYMNGEAIHKIAKEYGVKVHTLNEHLKDEGLHDESRSTLLKNKKAVSLEKIIDDNFIIELVKNNPLDSKDVWWEKAKEKYPWLLRKQMFEKITELGLERSVEEVNYIRSLKNTSGFQLDGRDIINKKNKKTKINVEMPKDEIFIEIAKNNPTYSKTKLSAIIKEEYPDIPLGRIKEKIKQLNIGNKEIIRAQEVKANTIYKVEAVFGSIENLVKLYMKNKLGSYSKIAKYINESLKEGLEVSARQVEKTITRHPSYVSKQSLPQLQLYEFVKSAFPNYEVIHEYQISKSGKRIDVFIKELNVGIEFNGDYWHSDEVIQFNYGLTSETFHKARVKDAKNLGIKLCYVWERDWNLNYDEVEKAILNKDWNNPILNKYSNSDYHRKVKAPNPNKSNSTKKQNREKRPPNI